MVAFSTIFLLVKIFQQPIRIFEISGYWSCHGEHIAKEHKKLGEKLMSKVTLHFVWGHLSKKQTVAQFELNHRYRRLSAVAMPENKNPKE